MAPTWFGSTGTLLACVLLTWCPSAFALDQSLDVSQYAHTSWKIRDGFVKGQILAIAQTPDGYLWLGTEFGLLRFDGVRNVPFQPPVNQRLPSSYIFSLLAARDGTLWIGTSKGLASWKDGRLTHYPELDGHYIFKILEDHEGAVWASGVAVTAGKLCAIWSGGVQCYGEDGALGPGASNLYEDSKGNLWVGVKDGLWRWKPGPPKFYSLAGEPDGIQALGEDGGALLVGWHGGVWRFIDGEIETYPLPTTVGQFHARRLLRDHDGGLWIATIEQGLVHVHRGRTDVFTTSDGLSSESIDDVFEDREGNIWVTTINGLDRFRDFAVASLTASQGLSNAFIGSVLADRDGGIWLATREGLDRWNDGQMTIYREHAGHTMTEVREIVGSGLPDKQLESLFQDDSGRVWVSTFRGVGYLKNDQFISISGIPGGHILSIVEDAAGTLWFAKESFGLYQLARGGEVRQIPWAALGHKDPVSTVAADPLLGGLWLGFHLGGVAYFADNQIRASFAAADGLGEGRVNHLRLDRDGVLWAATDGGLSRLKNGRVATLNSKNGLPCDTVHWTMEDDAHAFWLYTECGLMRVARPEIDAWTASVDKGEKAKQTVRATVFDSSDGVRILASGGHYSPQVAKSSDGRLWFLPWDGASVFDPNHLPLNQLPPPVHVEQFIADRKTYEATHEEGGRVQLGPLVHDLEIDYTALSLAAPEKVLFRYKLEGRDAGWQEAGNRRQAFYNDLPPGDYRFRVMASNNSGVWNETGTFLDFSVAPAFYQTRWFVAAIFALGVLLVGAIYHLRVRQIFRRMSLRFDERLAERTRVARELHDTFLQTVQGSKMVADHALRDPADHARMVRAMKQLSMWLEQATGEGRAALNSLRASTTERNDLAEAFRRAIDECRLESPIEIAFSIKGDSREMHPIVRDEIYRIGYEAIRNACAHSSAARVEVALEYAHDLGLRVGDNGLGIDSEIIEKGKQGHFGLPGMRERAERIGSKFNVVTSPGSGTVVTLIVPGRIVFRNAPPNWSERLKSLFSRN